MAQVGYVDEGHPHGVEGEEKHVACECQIAFVGQSEMQQFADVVLCDGSLDGFLFSGEDVLEEVVGRHDRGAGWWLYLII